MKIFMNLLYFSCTLKVIEAGLNVPYPGAEYFWPLTKKGPTNIIVDKISGEAHGTLHGGKFIKNDRLVGAVSFSGNYEWIEFPIEKMKHCIAKPVSSSCKYGFSIAFWIRFRRGKYILSTGSFTSSTDGTGVQITYNNATSRFDVLVRTANEFWKASTLAQLNTWCHIVLVWGVKNGLLLYLDENKKPVASAPNLTKVTDELKVSRINKLMTIARPPNLKQEACSEFDMAYLAIWHYQLIEVQARQTGGLALQQKELGPGRVLCHKKRLSCSHYPCGWKCHYGYPDAVCPDIEHKICKAITQQQDNSKDKDTAELAKESTTSLTFREEEIAEIYKNAVHYFHVKKVAHHRHQVLRLVDTRKDTKVRSSQNDGAIFKTTNQLGTIIKLNGRHDCINIRDMKFQCIKDPAKCDKTGFTLAIWLRDHNKKGQGEQYIAYSTNGKALSNTGFVISHSKQGKNFTVKVIMATKLWEIVLHEIPFQGDWWHLLITWNKQSGLSLYINGHFAVQSEKPQRRISLFTDTTPNTVSEDIVIGCTNRSNDFTKSLSEYGEFDFGHLAIWDRVLSSSEIRLAYKASIRETVASKECCYRKLGDECIVLPCHKFNKKDNCAHIFGSNGCICKESPEPNGTCIFRTSSRNCKDDPKFNCKKLSSQTGFCNYYQAEIQNRCPVSCHLCDGLYRIATHYFKADANNIVDIFAKSKTTTFPMKLNLSKTEQLGYVLSLNGQDYYVNIKGFQRECLTDPNECKYGLTVAFWLRMFSGKYVISGGQYRDEPRGSGFMIFHDANSSQFRISVATAKNKWTAVFHKIPFMRKWFHLAFSWSQKTELRVSINGRFVLQVSGARERKYSLQSTYEENGIFIGGKDSTEGGHSHVQFDIAHIAVWDYILDAGKIYMAYTGSIAKNPLALQCCKKLSENKCVANACYKFRAPESCEAFFNSNNCLCPEYSVQDKCKLHSFRGECKDKRPDCKEIAAQSGYCEFYQQDMEKLCPVACGFCDITSAMPVNENVHPRGNVTEPMQSNETNSNVVNHEKDAIVPHLRHQNETDKIKKTGLGSDGKKVHQGERNYSITSSKDEIKIENMEGDKNISFRKHPKKVLESRSHQSGERKSSKLSREVLIFSLIGCAAGIILLFLISLYSWKVYRSKFTGAFIPSFKTVSSIEVDEYGDEKWTKKYIDSSYFVIKDVPPKKRALPIIPAKPMQPKYHPPDFQ